MEIRAVAAVPHSRCSAAFSSCAVAVLLTGCAPIYALVPGANARGFFSSATGSFSPGDQPTRPAELTPAYAPHPVRKLIVIQARVDSRRRIVSGENPTLALSPVEEALVRELAPHGVLARGTEIDIVHEIAELASSHTDGRRLAAVRIRSGSSTCFAVLVGEGDNGPPLPYSLNGRPFGAELLRYPIPHTAITSGFSYSRKHPITKKRRPHLGVDFAAPFGTPVVAVADGEVVFAKWASGFGRLVRIQHDGDYASAYAHLQRYATGIKAGAFVTKGQVIGYVGNSGQATGPHLHFVLVRAGTPIDPLGTGIPAPPRLAGEALVALRSRATPFAQILAAADRANPAATRLASANP
jgi:murein DD-endopeptidase MepM/ murein hydrolase activator NlpD